MLHFSQEVRQIEKLLAKSGTLGNTEDEGDKGKPLVRAGRKATEPTGLAGLPNLTSRDIPCLRSSY